ncbi:MAG: thioredoxin domain-containing protein [Rhodocyclaceae bacterium]|nr:thioredoxin domain-containing protein [Rhodocyclaceae bacterium]
MHPSAAHPDPLVWGHGPKILEVFLEPTCPFSGRAFGKFEALLTAAGEDRLSLKLRLLSQPWHMFSAPVIRAILAAASLPEGKAAAWRVMEAVFAHREAFILTDHASGPNLDLSPRGVLARIEALSGLALSAAFEQPELQVAVKWHARYARQNGIHVTPTFMVDGLVENGMGSGDEVSVWLERLGIAP